MMDLLNNNHGEQGAVAGILSRLLKGLNFPVLINMFLAFVSVVAFANVVYSYRQPDPLEFRVPREKVSSLDSEFAKLPKISLKPLSYYEERISRRDIFSGVAQLPLVPGAKTAMSPSSAIEIPEFFRNLKLRGIIFAEQPQAIIQDARGKESFFVQRGDGLKDAVVKDITEDKVILDYRGEIVELIRK